MQEAKACFSEVVRRAQDGPQTVTVHGKPSVVVVSAAYFEQLGSKSGMDLIGLMGRAPLAGIDLREGGEAMPVREVKL